MALEIERKFLLKNDSWKALADQGQPIQQGYLSLEPNKTIRVRLKKGKGFLTIKGKTKHTTRQEFDYEIPFQDAQELLALCTTSSIQKTRFLVEHQGHTWEIDVFEGANEGLVVAEVELEQEQEEVLLPAWIGEEVSDDKRYYNASLVVLPFGEWE